MKTIEELAIETPIIEDLDTQYDNIIEALQRAKENKQPIDEGLFGSLFGGIAGATAGPAIMRAVCKALGVDERGTFGSLLTSRLVLSAIGSYIGWKQ